MKKITTAVMLILMLLSPVLAFNLVESIPIYSTDRQEGRIDAYWLIVEETNSYVSGYISPQKQTGKFKLYYEGTSGFDHDLWIKSDLKIDTIWDGTYGIHFSGVSGEYTIHDSDGITRNVEGVTFNGFFNQQSGQIYISFASDEFGLSWVTFIQQPLEQIQTTQR